LVHSTQLRNSFISSFEPVKKFLIKSSAFAIPFIFLFSLVAIVDSYNYFNFFKIIPIEVKQKISYKLNYALWKLVEYRRNPYPNILLGDSRMNRIDPQEIKNISGEDYYNFSYGGGTLEEICKTFWIADKISDLKNVYVGINFNLYNMSKSYDRVTGATAVLENPMLYIINRDVLKATFRILWDLLLNKNSDIEKPPMSREAFWDYQLDVTARRNYATYTYPNSLHKELQKIVKYRREKGINFFFVILPTHVSLQDKVQAFGLVKEYDKFLSDLKELGIVYNFNYGNEFTQNRDNFIDPYHLRKEAISSLILEIWGGENKYAIIFKPNYMR